LLRSAGLFREEREESSLYSLSQRERRALSLLSLSEREGENATR
jgi:hypothetical protein